MSKWLRCGECRELKPPEAFPLRAKNVSGRRGVCLVCRPPDPPPAPTPPPVPPRVAHAMCGKKRRYKRQSTALAAALRSARRTQLMRVYKCPLCCGWHLTHKRDRRSVR